MRTKSKKIPENPPADLEEVKRRFIRQNRDLAKANSTQSLRIRSLELENSRLLGDNLQLRERNLQLQRLCENTRARASGEAIRKIRDELQAKFSELSGFVVGLADFHQDDWSDEKSLSKERILSPSVRQYRERLPLPELMRDSQMPTIQENKFYPRRTLDTEEIRAIRLSDQGSNDSPELGPPPVVHFDYEGPVKLGIPTENTTTTVAAVSPNQAEEDALATAFSVNLETRRKRKEGGQSKLEIRRRSILAQPPPTEGDDQPTNTILRTGAKRKLSDRETEKPIQPPKKEEFTFSRKSASDYPDAERQPTSRVEPSTYTEKTKSRDVDSKPVSQPKPARKVLGDKSVNISPRKEVSKPDKLGKERVAPRTRRISSIAIPPLDNANVEPAAPETISVELPPETPAAADLFSPPPSESSSKQGNEGRDTPPPSDLSSMSNTTDGGQRPSRRARSTVNYAEPSLIAKMRRPDKTMVDAISGLQDPRRAMNASAERRGSRSAIVPSQTSDEEEAPWTDLHRPHSAGPELGSPLNQKSHEATQLPPAGALSEHTQPLPAHLHQRPRSSSEISTLIATSRRRRESQRSQPLGSDFDDAAKKMQELDLYEFKDSSSPTTDTSDRCSPHGAAGGGKLQLRRHSSIPKEIQVNTAGLKSDRMAARRRSMVV